MFRHLWNTCARLLRRLIAIYGEFEREARERLRGRDETDWPVFAIALGFDCDVWSEDQDFFGTGVAVWTTNRIEILLKSSENRPRAEEVD